MRLAEASNDPDKQIDLIATLSLSGGLRAGCFSLSHSLLLSHTPSHSLSLTHTLYFSLSQTHTHKHTHFFYLSHSLSLFLTTTLSLFPFSLCLHFSYAKFPFIVVAGF